MNDTLRYDAYVDVAFEYIFKADFDSALVYAGKANSIAYAMGDTAKIVASSRYLSKILSRLGRVEDSKLLCLRMLPVVRRNGLIKEESELLCGLAVSLTYLSRYDSALRCNLQSLDISEIIYDSIIIRASLNNIGLVFYKLKNFDKAIEYYKRALILEQKNGNFLNRLLVNLCLCYLYKGDINTARKYLDESIALSIGSTNHEFEIERAFASGKIFLLEKEFQKAEASFNESYRYALISKNDRFKIESILGLAENYLSQGRYKLARCKLKEASKIIETSPYNDVHIYAYNLLSELSFKTNDFRNANAYQLEYIHLRDSLYSENLTQNLMAIQTEYEQRDEKAKIESQNRALALKGEVIEKQSILTIIAGVAVVLLGLLVSVFFRTNQKKKLVNDILEQKVEERTLELTNSYQLIQKAYNDQTLFVNQALGEMKMPLSTLMQLYSSKSKVTQHGRKYISRLNETTEELTNVTEKFLKTVEL